jgi:hypothetical protein
VAKIGFDEARHEYTVGGRIIPSVTQILGILQDFGGVPADVLDRAAEFGTHVHHACALDNARQLDEAALDPGLLPYLAQWRRFLAESGGVVLASEQRVYHPGLHYAGTLDALVSIRGKVALVDIKTGQLPRTVGAQTIAYEEAYSSDSDNPHCIRRRMCVQLTADAYKTHPLTNHADWPLFQSCLNVWRFKNAA